MTRYVILEHDHPYLHWDFMLAVGGALRTWRLAAPPADGQTTAATPLGDHRVHYLDYEGPVSGGRGTVKRWDAGTYTGPVDEARTVVVGLQGWRLRGEARLERTTAGEWRFAFAGQVRSTEYSVLNTRIVPLGDQAALAYLPDEAAALAFAAAARARAEPWLVDVVQAYTSVAVHFSLDRITFADVLRRLEPLAHTQAEMETPPGRTHRIPCCYEFQLDLARVAQHTGLDADEVIRLHTGTEYTVYAIGFCPGFPYLGYLPPALAGVPRLETPRVRLAAGSVGLTGRQTGIYPLPRPGGWNILARTPLELVHVADGYFPLRTGDRVQFERIDEAEFRRLEGERLQS